MKPSVITLLTVAFFLTACDNKESLQYKRNSENSATERYKNIDMNRTDGLDSYDFVDKHPVIEPGKRLEIIPDTNASIRGMNRISSIVSDGAGGYYLAGSMIDGTRISERWFTSQNYTDFANDSKVQNPAIRSAVKHYDQNLTLISASRNIDSDTLLPSAIVTRGDHVIVAMQPAQIGQKLALESFILIFDKKLKELRRIRLDNINFNNMLLAKNGDLLLIGTRKRPLGYNRDQTYEEVIMVFDRHWNMRKEMSLEQVRDVGEVYSAASLVSPFKDGYVIGGIDYTTYLNGSYDLKESILMYPYLSANYSYYPQGMYVSRQGSIALYGYYGHESNPNMFDHMPDPYDTMRYAGSDKGALGISGNKEMQQRLYRMMYSEYQRMNQHVSKPFKNLILSEETEINTVKKGYDAPSYRGASEVNGLLYVERMYEWHTSEGGKELRMDRELYDQNLSLRFRIHDGTPRCNTYCSVVGNDLLYITKDADNALWLNRESFR
jgi:hypothetical protein